MEFVYVYGINYFIDYSTKTTVIPLMSGATNGCTSDQEQIQQNSQTLATDYVAAPTSAQPGSNSTSCAQSATVAAPKKILKTLLLLLM
jgi:hypothetical protein